MSIRRVIPILCFAIFSACSDSSSPAAPAPAGAGVITVNLVGSHPNDGAVQLTIRGPGITAVTAARPDYMVFNSPFMTGQQIAIFGPIETGALVTFRVPDVSRLATYTIEIEQVADESGALRANLDPYEFELTSSPDP